MFSLAVRVTLRSSISALHDRLMSLQYDRDCFRYLGAGLPHVPLWLTHLMCLVSEKDGLWKLNLLISIENMWLCVISTSDICYVVVHSSSSSHFSMFHSLSYFHLESQSTYPGLP